MTNARREFVDFVGDRVIKCAEVYYHSFSWIDDSLKIEFTLKVDAGDDEYQVFLNQLDFEYDAGYGSQELFGTIWFDDGTWAERGEYDGAEWWEICERPEIPEYLKG